MFDNVLNLTHSMNLEITCSKALKQKRCDVVLLPKKGSEIFVCYCCSDGWTDGRLDRRPFQKSNE